MNNDNSEDGTKTVVLNRAQMVSMAAVQAQYLVMSAVPATPSAVNWGLKPCSTAGV